MTYDKAADSWRNNAPPPPGQKQQQEERETPAPPGPPGPSGHLAHTCPDCHCWEGLLGQPETGSDIGAALTVYGPRSE